MPDVLAIAALIACFSIAVLFVRACERIIGPDGETGVSDSTQPDLSEPDPGRRAA
jgi:organic hydroperoxide reductase OsmC/OhrA